MNATVHLTASNSFSPSDLNVSPGNTVRWVADTNTGHTVTPDNAAQAGTWTSAPLSTTGATFDHTFAAA